MPGRMPAPGRHHQRECLLSPVDHSNDSVAIRAPQRAAGHKVVLDHCCPVKTSMTRDSSNDHNNLQRISGVPDLNGIPARSPLCGLLPPRGPYEYGQNAVCSDHGLSSVEDLSPGGLPVRQGLSCSHFALCGTFPRSGLCPADLSGKLARHRSLPLGTSPQALPYGRFDRRCAAPRWPMPTNVETGVSTRTLRSG